MPSPHACQSAHVHISASALIAYELTVRATGKRVQDEEIHLYEFNADGKVAAFRHFLDTTTAIEAHS